MIRNNPSQAIGQNAPSNQGTLQALNQLVGRDRTKAPKRTPGERKVPPAVGLRRRYPGAPAGMSPSDINRNFGGSQNAADPSDASRQGNFQNAVAMNRRRNLGAPRRSAARPPIY